MPAAGTTVGATILPTMDLGQPVSYLVVEPGTDVYSADGERVGTLQHVLADEENDIFDGIVIDTERGPGGLRFADAPDVAELREKGVVLGLAAADVGNLPKPEANPAVMEHHGDEDTESSLQAKLRRAWDLISGNY
jgi:PRC-barrel domain